MPGLQREFKASPQNFIRSCLRMKTDKRAESVAEWWVEHLPSSCDALSFQSLEEKQTNKTAKLRMDGGAP